MTTIIYVEAQGQAVTVDVADGWTLMQGAVANGVEGILGECGGSCACATCHCYVDEARIGELPPPTDNELDMLEDAVAPRRSNSRLACQVKVHSAMAGLIVHLPDRQQ